MGQTWSLVSESYNSLIDNRGQENMLHLKNLDDVYDLKESKREKEYGRKD